MALISKNTPFRTLNERRFSYLLKRSQLKQVASSGRYTLKQKTRGVTGEDSPLERCGLRTGGERIVLGEDNIPTEEQRRDPRKICSGRIALPLGTEDEQRPIRAREEPTAASSPSPPLPSPSPSCYLHYHHTRTAPTTFSPSLLFSFLGPDRR